jgi:prophage antirepressor-like protein
MPQNAEDLTTLFVIAERNVRQVWHDNEWFFSVVDVIAALTESADPRRYWSRLKKRAKEDWGFELDSMCTRLKLPASDGKLRETDCANTENMLHIVQYVPSKKAIPFREWLAQVGAERLEEIADPEKALNEWKERAIQSFMAHGYSEGWARNRVDSLIARNNVTGSVGYSRHQARRVSYPHRPYARGNL